MTEALVKLFLDLPILIYMFQALVKLFLDLQEKHCRGLIQASVRPADVVHTIQVEFIIKCH